MQVEGCRLRNVTFILGEMRAKKKKEEEEKEDGGRDWGAVVDGWLEEALKQLFKSWQENGRSLEMFVVCLCVCACTQMHQQLRKLVCQVYCS